MARQPAASAAELQQATGAPRSTVYRILSFYQHHLARIDGTADVRRVLGLAADLRRDRAVPDVTFRLRDDLHQMIDQTGRFQGQQAFASAANALGFFELTDLHLRVDVGHRAEALAAFRPLHRPKGQSLVHLYFDHLARYPAAIVVGAALVTDPVVTMIDLKSHPRAGAHAEFFDSIMVRLGLLPERRS